MSRATTRARTPVSRGAGPCRVRWILTGSTTLGAARPVLIRRTRPSRSVASRAGQAAFALVAYMSTYSWPESRMTSAITESVTARST